MSDEFKPPWDYFPQHTTHIPPFKVVLSVGFDQGDLINWIVGFCDEDGVMSSFGGSGERWRDVLHIYLEYIVHAKWLTEIEESGEPRYIRLNHEYDQWEADYRKRRFGQ